MKSSGLNGRRVEKTSICSLRGDFRIRDVVEVAATRGAQQSRAPTRSPHDHLLPLPSLGSPRCSQWPKPGFCQFGVRPHNARVRAWATAVSESNTNEIQKNIIAKAILGL